MLVERRNEQLREKPWVTKIWSRNEEIMNLKWLGKWNYAHEWMRDGEMIENYSISGCLKTSHPLISKNPTNIINDIFLFLFFIDKYWWEYLNLCH